jgi:ABC-type cobalamin transport system permease subunit
VSSFSPDQFNVHFLPLPQGFVLRLFSTGRKFLRGLPLSVWKEDEVFAAIMQIGSVAVRADGFSLKFIKIVLPHILSVLTHLFNFSIPTSTFPSAWKTALVLL